MKTTQKSIRQYVKLGTATDITNYSHAKLMELRSKCTFETVGSSFGKNGRNGILIKDQGTGKLYAVTARNSALAFFY